MLQSKACDPRFPLSVSCLALPAGHLGPSCSVVITPPMAPVLLRPGFQHDRDGPSIVGNQRQPLLGCFLQESGIVQAQEAAVFLLGQTMDRQRPMPTAEANLHLT
jgi:hypothetical protein